VSDLFDISISALQAFQSAIAVTSNNIANANTPGYADESVQLESVAHQTDGSVQVGGGVDVASVNRAVNQLSNNQLNSSQSSLGQLNSLQTYTNQVDNIIGTTAGGLTTGLQSYYSAWSTVADDPTSTSSRQALLSQAQSVASSFQTTNSQLQALNTGINSSITADVNQINSLSTSIATLNQQIVSGTAQAAGQAPNELLDQRDAALSSLSKLVGVTTHTESNGALDVFVGNGQQLVVGDTTNALTTVSNQYNGNQLEVSSVANAGVPISSQITSGDLGGLLAARSQVVNPAISQVGQIATALAATANAQQNSGLDLTGKQGANIFSVGVPQGVPSSQNASTATATVSISNLGALTSDNYELTYKAGAYSLTDVNTGSAVTLSGAGTAANPLTANGVSIVIAGTPASGDSFLIEPTAQAAGSFAVTLTNPSQLAAASALQVTPATTNTGGATLGGVLNPNASAIPATTTIKFTSATQYQVNGGATQTLGTGGTVSFAGWQATLSGTPAVGDTFTLQSDPSATGDNTNALASAAQQTKGVLSGGTTSVNGATSALITAIGSQAQQVNTAQTAQTAVNTQALANVQSVSGVNLDEEAANLLQWQQAYQASAQALSIGNATFTTFMDSINGTYS
jgi:flagellar hook-associated protein 1 FlgK